MIVPVAPSRVRRLLRTAQLATGVWVAHTLVTMLAAPPARADNCAVFTDCFGVANSSVEAAFGLSLLAALSLVLDFVPVVGTGKGLIEAAIGRDLLTGQELAPWERALGVLPMIGGLTALKYVDDVAGAVRHLDGAGDLAGAGRHLDGAGDLAGTGRHLDDAGNLGDDLSGTRRVADDARDGVPQGPRPWAETDGVPLAPEHRRLVDEYRAASGADRAQLSQTLGERGAVQYLSDVTGRDVALLHARSADDVRPLLEQVEAGQAWSEAVAFRGSRATNLVYFDGEKLIVVEAKGGGSGYGDRMARWVTDGMDSSGRIPQTHPNYPLDVAGDMLMSNLTDGRNEIGELIQSMYRLENVEYAGVRTGPYAALVQGDPRVILENVFLRPVP